MTERSRASRRVVENVAGALGNDKLAAAALSWVAGYIDTTGFLKLNGLFTAHVTGNLVVAGARISGYGGGEAFWVHFAVMPFFFLAVVATALAQCWGVSLRGLLRFESLALMVFAVLGIALVPVAQRDVSPLQMFVVGSAGVFAMGVQNALMRESFRALPPTTVMTGNLSQFTIDLAELLLFRGYQSAPDSGSRLRELRQRLSKFGGALLGFILGVAFGAYFMLLLGFWSILLPAVVTASLGLILRAPTADHLSNPTQKIEQFYSA